MNPSAGGPRDIKMLYSLEDLKGDFKNYQLLLAENTVAEFKEGNYHVGEGSVCRFVARKSI